jgi:hypothetical protein
MPAGAHANVGGGYASDVLAQAPPRWLMEKAAACGLRFRSHFATDAPDLTALPTDSYVAFGNPLLRLFSRRFLRPVGPEPHRGTERTTFRINETIDGSIFDRYRPANPKAWADRHGVDLATLQGTVRASDPTALVEQPQVA